MELDFFREKMRELHEKSGMDWFLDWPLVYDEDEVGNIYINSAGTFFFADSNSNWSESHLNLNDVLNLRYERAFEEGGIDNEDDDPSESSIYINFVSGEYIWLWNQHDTYSVESTVRLTKTDCNAQFIESLDSLSRTKELRIQVI